jgi:alpha-1,2-mannosyltransferase
VNRTLAAIILVLAVFVVGQLAWVYYNDSAQLDLLVYRAGGHAVLTGNSVYAPDFAAVNDSPRRLPFTYPPFAALIFAPLAILPALPAKALMVVLNALAAAVFLVVVIVAVPKKWERLNGWNSFTAPISRRNAAVVFASAAIFLVSTPVLSTFGYGQVNLILAAAIALDMLLPSVRWPRGLMVGLAAAIKVAPVVFFAYFLVTRRWRALAVSMATSVAAVALTWLLMPGDTIQYFRHTIFDIARIGGLAFASNQSLRGVIERNPALDSIRGVLWMTATVAVLALAVVAIEVSRRLGDTVGAMLSVAIAGLLCSPVSWGHHWVWLSSAAVYFLLRWATIGGPRNLAAGIAVAMIAVGAPWIFLSHSDDRERLWNPFEHMLGMAWAITGLALLISFAMAGLLRRAAEPLTLSKVGAVTGETHHTAPRGT